MPGMDRTGPRGEGPMTGRGLGPCGRGLARGFGRGLGLGRGFGWRARSILDYSTEPVELTKEEQKKILEAEKQAIEKRLKELE